MFPRTWWVTHGGADQAGGQTGKGVVVGGNNNAGGMGS